MINNLIDGNELKRCKSIPLLGILAVGEEKYPNIGREQRAVTPGKRGSNVNFYIKSLSDEPEIIKNIDEELEKRGIPTFYIGFDNRLDPEQLPPGYRYNDDVYSRADNLESFLEKKLILFYPVINHEENKGRVHKNVEIIGFPDELPEDEEEFFNLIPEIDLENQELERILMKKDSISIMQIEKMFLNSPVVICKNHAYLCRRINTEEYITSDNSIAYSIKKLKISERILESKSLNVDDKAFLVRRESFEILYEKINNNGLSLMEPSNIKRQKKISLEFRFLEDLETTALSQGLYYRFCDLVDFHIAVKTNPFTMINGMSGTGKTQLAELYAQALGLSAEAGTLLRVPISPSYLEPNDVLGFLNPNTNLYFPMGTGIVDFLLHAEQNPEKMHICILEEMNLARIEHYFAPLLSLVEIKDTKERNLHLYNDKAVCRNRLEYPSKINIGNNIRFIGTVSFDEITKDLSDRLLDRINISYLRKPKFTTLKEKIEEYKNQEIYQKEEKGLKDILEKESLLEFNRTKNYSSWINTDKARDAYTLKEAQLLDDLHALIQQNDPRKGISFRFFIKLGEYLNNIPTDENGSLLLSRSFAIDLQVKQRILTKLRGPLEQLEYLIGTLNLKGDLENSKLCEFFEKSSSQEISGFENSIELIRRKAKELYNNGYTS